MSLLPDDFPVPPQVVTVAWQAVQGDVLLPLDYADWLGASLSILLAAVHHPQELAEQQPGTDARNVAAEVLDEVPEIHLAAHTADQQRRPTSGVPALPARVGLRLEQDQLRVSPGGELANLGLSLEVFAKAVLDPDSDDARTARGAIAYSAAAWSRELGVATGAFPDPRPRQATTSQHPTTAADRPPPHPPL